jgi:thioredoxin
MKNLTTNEFKEQIFDYENNSEWKFNGEIPTIISFSAQWCGPCKMITPVLDELNNEYNGKINVYKVDVDDEFQLSEAFNIRSVPTIMFIPKNGQPKRLVGGTSKQKFKDTIKEVMNVE